jgi:hypothetical protein
MGMIKIDMWGSFPRQKFTTSAEEGGHVAALKRSIEFLTGELGTAVCQDAQLTKEGIKPQLSPLGTSQVE